MQPQLANNVQQATSPWFAQIRKLVESATSLEQIRDGLEQLIPNMTLDQYALAMGEAMAAAQLAGRYEVLQEAGAPDGQRRVWGLALQRADRLFQRKLNLPTTAWTDIYTQEHDWAFVVAGANRDAIVSDFARPWKRPSDGTTLEEFRRDFDRIVAKHGWDYNGRNWRSRVIYDTNLATSYAWAAGSSCSTPRTGSTSTATG
jgi:hypothetical protein